MTKKRSASDRLSERIIVASSGCWEVGGSLRNRYPSITDDRGNSVYTHRLAYTIWVGPIADGLHIDHLCRNTRCCNPDHLEPVTQAVNNQRAWDARERSEVCVHGHALRGANLYVNPKGERKCRQCAKDHRARYLAFAPPRIRKPLTPEQRRRKTALERERVHRIRTVTSYAPVMGEWEAVDE